MRARVCVCVCLSVRVSLSLYVWVAVCYCGVFFRSLHGGVLGGFFFFIWLVGSCCDWVLFCFVCGFLFVWVWRGGGGGGGAAVAMAVCVVPLYQMAGANQSWRNLITHYSLVELLRTFTHKLNKIRLYLECG